MISATDKPFCASISLLSSTKLQPIFFRQHLAQRGFAGATQSDQRDTGKRHPPCCGTTATREHILGLGDLRRCRLAHEIANDRPVGRRFGRGNEIFQMRAHCVRYPAQQHDRDVAPAAFELRDIAFGNAGDFREHFSRHAAQRPHGANTLAELLQKAGFGGAGFGHVPQVEIGCKSASFGNIMPMSIDSKHARWSLYEL